MLLALDLTEPERLSRYERGLVIVRALKGRVPTAVRSGLTENSNLCLRSKSRLQNSSKVVATLTLERGQ